MKYLHITNTDKFIEPYIKFVNKYFDSEEHLFFAFSTHEKDFIVNTYQNLRKFKKILWNRDLFKELNAAEKIFLHSLFDTRVIFLLFACPWLLKKCYWIVWGGDLYQYREPRHTFKSRRNEFLRAKVFRKMGNIVTLVRGDYELAKEWYKVTGTYFHGEYVDLVSREFIESLTITEKSINDPIHILVGNSADPSNNHMEAFNILSRFKEENIRIYVPLSYGDKEYSTEIFKAGTQLFGKKFVGLTDFLPPDEYFKILSNIDIGVFNNNRQQALGNIYGLLYLNKKIFIRPDTTMWEDFKEQGLVMNDLLSIEEIDFNEFIENKAENRDKINSLLDQGNAVEIWEKVFK